jgi:hypothetical protein
MKKTKYVSPVVLQSVSLEMEEGILAGSAITSSTNVQTTGQEVVTYDFTPSSSSPFNHEWE